MAKSEQTTAEVTKLENEFENHEQEEQGKDDDCKVEEPSEKEEEDGSRTSSMPQFQYDKKHMYHLGKLSLCLKRPDCLASEHLNTSGVWDPEKWFRARHGESPVLSEEGQAFGGTKRASDPDIRIDPKKRSSDPKERIKEEMRDDIVLSPQRRSFGTGCHVTNQRRLGSPVDAHDIGHKDSVLPSRDSSSRRIGSGRLGNRSNSDRQESDREYGYKPPSHREYSSGRFKDKDHDRSKRNNRNRMPVQEEPEWYSEGPASQSEFIELRGFEDPPAENEENVRKFSGRNEKGRRTRSPLVEMNSDKGKSSPRGSLCLVDKNGSLETNANESSSPSNSEGTPGAPSHEFDVNELFKMESLPGFPMMMPSVEPTQDHERSSPSIRDHGLGGSRFSQWRNTLPTSENWPSHFMGSEMGTESSHENFLSNILDDSDPRDVIPSPPMNSFPSQQKNILEILQNANINVEPQVLNNMSVNNAKLKQQAMEGKAKSVEELEAGLKQLVFGNNEQIQRNDSSSLNNMVFNNNQHQQSNNVPAHEENSAFNKLLSSMTENGHGLTQSTVGPPIDKSRAMSEKQLLQDILDDDQVQAMNNMNHLMKNSPNDQDILNRLFNRQIQTQSNDALSRMVKHQQDMLRRVSPTPQDILSSIRHPTTFSPGLIGEQEMTQPQNQSGIQQREMLMSLLKQQQPLIQQQPVSPIMGHPILIPSMGRISPVNHSPLLQDSYQQQQQQQRAPSPLLFSQQPPMISHAPSPIHPAQGVQSVPPPNTLQIQNSSTIPRVPSPQELIVRTQAIYHNALIQKKVEEQRGNFRRKQELSNRPFSPNNVQPSKNIQKSDSPHTKVTMATFTPTSVMRKMHSDSKSGSDGKSSSVSSEKDVLTGAGNSSPARNGHPRPLHGQGVMNSQGMMSSQSSQIPTIAVQCEVSPPRPIIKANPNSPKITSYSNRHSANEGSQPSGSHPNFSDNRNVDQQSINKFLEQQQQLKMQIGSPSMYRHQIPPNVVGQMPLGMSPNIPPPLIVPQSNLSLQAQQQQQQQQQASAEMFRNLLAQQKVTKIRGQSNNIGMGGHSPHQPSALITPAAFNPRKMPPSTPNAQSIHQILHNQRMGHPNTAINGQAQPINAALHKDSQYHSSRSGGGGGNPANLTKWFGTEILKHNLPTMPPVPTQKALSLEEVERQQQVA